MDWDRGLECICVILTSFEREGGAFHRPEHSDAAGILGRHSCRGLQDSVGWGAVGVGAAGQPTLGSRVGAWGRQPPHQACRKVVVVLGADTQSLNKVVVELRVRFGRAFFEYLLMFF